MGDATEEQHITRLHSWFVHLRQIDARRQASGYRILRFVASGDADEATTVFAEPRRFVLQSPGYIDLFHKLAPVEVLVFRRILSVQRTTCRSGGIDTTHGFGAFSEPVAEHPIQAFHDGRVPDHAAEGITVG
ncbi:MAG: hypothetical protein VX255_03285 [Candidatus Latescibacterota bacterium]|nr:hypothetical protein [Candidatus Latescibacterota bacterium]